MILVHINILKSNFIPGDLEAPLYNFLYDWVLIFSILTFFPVLSITARRLNDVNQSSWRLTLAIIIFIASNLVFNQYLGVNDLSLNILYIIPALISIYLLKGVFYLSDDSNKESPSGWQENSLVSPVLFIVITIFSFSWNPQFIYEIKADNKVVTNPYLTKIRSKGLLDLIGFGDCTHTLQDGTCFTEGNYSIVNTLEVETPPDLSVWFWEDFYVPFFVDKNEIRHARRKITYDNMSCNLDHVEFQGEVNEDLLFLMKGLLNQIYSDPNRCTSKPSNQPIAIDVYLSSPGGYVVYGNLLAVEMKKLGVTTHISPDQVCASMCTSLFLAGKERIMHSNSQLAFHSAYFPGLGGNGFMCDKRSSDSIYYYIDKKLADIVASDFLNVCNPVNLKTLNPGSALAFGLATKSL